VSERFYAHSLGDKPPENWHPLAVHLRNVAQMAAGFAAKFSASSWAYLAGLWHDLGKYKSDFQTYLCTTADASIEAKPGKVNHSSAGGILAIERFGKVGRILSYLILGHHTGLPDWQSEKNPRASLYNRLSESHHLEKIMDAHIPKDILDPPQPKESAKSSGELSRSMWLRMLFSCLVDADFLDTEAFMEPERSARRRGYPTLAEMEPFFEKYMAEKTVNAADIYVNRLRAEVLLACREKAIQAPGLFTLTVPTGGGKTLSSLAFALKHALMHGKNRIIYVIPYTSIIEQTADQFRAIFGENVLEHHSNLDVDPSKENARSRLASENWDAPLIVTTNVQFFESLFASRTSRCRKIHNIVNSVVILDEAQLLPPDFLKPVLEVIKELQQDYGVTFLFSTATQPALGPHVTMDYKFSGIPDLREIIPDPLALYGQLRRTSVEVIDGLAAPLSWNALASRFTVHDSVLCIVNRRDDARILWEKMPAGTFHLSALMCGAHRSERIVEIKESLVAKQTTRVVSTQLVEAGVDFDFPVVYRALAGLDSVAQAAGRCNREGLLAQGIVHIFLPESTIPAGHLRQAAEIGRQLLVEDATDPLSPKRFESFFKQFYWLRAGRLDREGILGMLANDPELRISFRTAAERFRLIDENAYAPVLVHYGKGSRLIETLRHQGPERWLLRQLQRYVVNLPRYVHTKLLAEGAIEEVHPGIFVQGHDGLYHDQLGFRADRSGIYEPDELMV